MEIWKDIIGYEGLYQVSNKGRVKSLKRFKRMKGAGIGIVNETILKFKKRKDPYKCVELYKEAKSKVFRVHRLVAQAFLPNPNNYPVVSHLDNNPSNNCVSNLQWATQSLNIIHCVANNRHRWKSN